MEDRNIIITIDYQDDLSTLIGRLNIVSEQSKLIYKMLEEGYSFDIAPRIVDGKLESVSILTNTAKKIGTNREFKRTGLNK